MLQVIPDKEFLHTMIKTAKSFMWIRVLQKISQKTHVVSEGSTVFIMDGGLNIK